MKIELTQEATSDYLSLPVRVRRAFDKQVGFLMQDMRYPSLRAKKYVVRGNKELWQARVDRRYRFYFEVYEDHYLVLTIVDHPK